MLRLCFPRAWVVSFVLWTTWTGFFANFWYTFTSTWFYLSTLPPRSVKEPFGEDRGDGEVLDRELCSMANLLFFSYFSWLLMLILFEFGSWETFFRWSRLTFWISFSFTPVSFWDSMIGSSNSETMIGPCVFRLLLIPLPPLAESCLRNLFESPDCLLYIVYKSLLLYLADESLLDLLLSDALFNCSLKLLQTLLFELFDSSPKLKKC